MDKFKSVLQHNVFQYVDQILSRQLHTDDDRDGGLECPRHHYVHGRVGDAIFPVYYVYTMTKDSHYLTAARKLLAFIIRHQQPDGSWYNEPFGTDWKGTTVFQTLSLVHAYDLLSQCGMKDDLPSIRELIRSSSEWIYNAFGLRNIKSNVNYPITSALVLEYASRVLGIPHYSETARDLIETEGLGGLNGDGLLHGEKGGIDIGYNMEMSLAALAEYAIITGRDDIRDEAVRAVRGHLRFLYPDGSMDNSFGTRSYKWTLFGSKTAHGSQMALAMLCDQDASFAEAALRNATYMDKHCTSKDGWIGYGPDYDTVFSECCIHTSINRADSYTVAIVYGKEPKQGAQPEEWQQWSGARYIPSVKVGQMYNGFLMGTISCSEVEDVPAGGTVSYLWSKQHGAIQVGCVTKYALIESFNMPTHPDIPYKGPTTPRLEAVVSDVPYSSLYDPHARLFIPGHAEARSVASGTMRHRSHSIKGPNSGIQYEIEYELQSRSLCKTYRFSLQHPCEELSIIEPVIIPATSTCKLEENHPVVQHPCGAIHISGEGAHFQLQLDTLEARIRSVFPAVQCVPLTWSTNHLQPGIYTFVIRIRL